MVGFGPWHNSLQTNSILVDSASTYFSAAHLLKIVPSFLSVSADCIEFRIQSVVVDSNEYVASHSPVENPWATCTMSSFGAKVICYQLILPFFSDILANFLTCWYVISFLSITKISNQSEWSIVRTNQFAEKDSTIDFFCTCRVSRLQLSSHEYSTRRRCCLRLWQW